MTVNRYITDGIKADLAKGLRVGVVAPGLVTARQTFDDVARSIGDEARRITRTNGAERITTASGGELRIFSVSRERLRGVQLDVLVILNRDLLSAGRMTRLWEDIEVIRAIRPELDVIAN